jgi:hypothetical protein
VLENILADTCSGLSKYSPENWLGFWSDLDPRPSGGYEERREGRPVSKGATARRPRKYPPTELLHKPERVDIWTFLVPYLAKLGDAYPKAVSILTRRAGQRKPDVDDAVHTTVVKWITRWIKSACVRIPISWEATLSRESARVLFKKPTKDSRLVTFTSFARDDESPGFPPPPSRIPSPPEEAIRREAELPKNSSERLVVLLWRSGFTLKQIAEALAISTKETKVLLFNGTQPPGTDGLNNDFS